MIDVNEREENSMKMEKENKILIGIIVVCLLMFFTSISVMVWGLSQIDWNSEAKELGGIVKSFNEGLE